LHYATGTPFGLLFFLVNLSFVRSLALALRALGRRFTVKSFVSDVLVLYLQDRHGLHAGKVQMAVDGAIVLAALVLVPARSIARSILGSVLLKLVLATNHRPDRHLRM